MRTGSVISELGSWGRWAALLTRLRGTSVIMPSQPPFANSGAVTEPETYVEKVAGDVRNNTVLKRITP